jgi:transposase InsO family protein
MARVLGVSEAGFHAWRRRPASAHAVADAALLNRIRMIHAGSPETYGAPRVHAELRAGGEKHGRKRIARLMRAAGSIGASRRRGTIVTTRRDKESRPAPDLVDRDFTAFRPNQLWVADMVGGIDGAFLAAWRQAFISTTEQFGPSLPSPPTGATQLRAPTGPRTISGGLFSKAEIPGRAA